jgi:acetyltransferase-like isoleucine patch superfamily enzyme
MTSFFDEKTPLETRLQILTYQAASAMSDGERAAFLGLPKGCRIRENAKIISPEKLVIGESCWIGEGAILDASGGLTIGSHTSIGLSVFVWTHDSHQLNIRGQNDRDQRHRIRRKPTSIGSNCFIAGPSVILPGVKIGDKCLVPPMSVIGEDLPDRTIYDRPGANAVHVERFAELQARVEALERIVRRLSGASS